MEKLFACFFCRGKIFLLCLVLLLTTTANAQELILYAIPSKKNISWDSPGSLLKGYLKNILTKSKYKGYGHPMGHVIVELRDTGRSQVMGMVAVKVSELGSKAAWKGYGIGVMYTASQGLLREGEKNIEDLSLHYPGGDVAYLRFKISDSAFNRLWRYHCEYKEYGFDKIYNGLNRPREGKGAGCSAYGVSFIEVAGLLPEDILHQWQMKVNVPEKLIGGPHRNGKWVGLHRVLLTHRWADTSREQFRPLAYYEPSLMYAWIVGNYQHEIIPGIGKIEKEYRGKAIGLVIDLSGQAPPDEPIWWLEPSDSNIVSR